MNNLKYSRTACLLWRYLRREFFDEFAVTRVHDKRIKWFWMTAACYFCWFAWKPKRSRSHSSKTTSLLLLSHPVASPTTERERNTSFVFLLLPRKKLVVPFSCSIFWLQSRRRRMFSAPFSFSVWTTVIWMVNVVDRAERRSLGDIERERERGKISMTKRSSTEK